MVDMAKGIEGVNGMTRRGFVAAAAAVAAGAGMLAAGTAGAAEASEGGDAAASTEADLIVVGAGSAGLAAAAKAAQDGASVIVLEAQGATGGTTKLSGGHWKFINDWFMSALPERTEDSDATISEVLDWDPADFGDFAEACETCKADVEEYLASDSTLEFDSVEYWLCLHYLGVQGTDLDGNEARDDYDVVAPAYYNSGEIADWLAEGGLTWSDPQPGNRGDGGPLSVEPTGQGFGLVTVLEEMATEAGAQIVLNAKVTGLTTDGSGRVTGVTCEDGTAYTADKAVLIAAGGYASNPELVAEQNVFTGIDDTAPSCEPANNDGTLMLAAQELGAATANTAFVQFFGFPEPNMGSIETLFPLTSAAKLIVNKDGERFTNDAFGFFGGGKGDRTEPICNQPSGRYYFVGDAAAQQNEPLAQSYADYVEAGTIIEGDTVADAAAAAGLDGDAVAATVEQFNGYVDAGEDPDFGRDLSQASKVEEAPFIVIPMAAYAQNTMGGLVINDKGQVVDEAGEPIEGLYAAGEATGNFDGACRRHGDNFAQILYYGYLVGSEAAEA